MLSNSIGTTRELWARQIEAFASVYRVIRYDARGHGESGVPAGEYTLEQLGGDALAILDAEGIASAHVCGLSLGGITAMWLGVHAPERVTSLVLANTAARIGSVESWTERLALVRSGGMAAVAQRAMGISVLRRVPSAVARHGPRLPGDDRVVFSGRLRRLLRGAPRQRSAAGNRGHPLPDAGHRGAEDIATTIEGGRISSVDRIRRVARMVTLDSAAHLS